MEKKKLNNINLRLEVISSCAKIGISKTSVLYGIGRKTIYRWKKNYQTNGISGLANKSRRKQPHPSKMPKEIKQKIISLTHKQPNISISNIIRTLKITYSLKTVSKILKEYATKPVQINENTLPFHCFYINIEKTFTTSLCIPAYLINIVEYSTGFTFTGFTNTNNPHSAAIFIDYFFCKIQPIINPKSITLLTCKGRFHHSHSKKETLFETIVKQKYGVQLLHSTKQPKIGNQLIHLLQLGSTSSKEEFMKIFYMHQTELNLVKIKNADDRFKKLLFLPPLYTDSHFRHIKQLQIKHSCYWNKKINPSEKLINNLFTHLISGVEKKIKANRNLTHLESFGELFSMLSLDDKKHQEIHSKLLFKFSQALDICGEWHKAEETIFKIIKISKYKPELSDDNIKALEFIGDINDKNGFFEKAGEFYRKALRKINREKKSAVNAIPLYKKLADSLMSCGSFKKSIYYYHKMLDLSQKTHNSEYCFKAKMGIVLIYKTKGNYNYALKLLNQLLLSQETWQNTDKLAEIYLEQAYCYSFNKNYLSSEISFEKLLILYKKLNMKEEYLRIQGMMGRIKQALHKDEEAKICFSEYVDFLENTYKQTNDDLTKTNALLKIGAIKGYLHDFQAAIKFINKTILLSKKIDNKETQAYAYNNLSNIYKNMGYYKKALSSALKGFQLQKNNMDFSNQLLSMRNISAIYIHIKHYKKTELWLKKLAELAQETNSNIYQIEAFKELGILQYKKKNIKGCIRYLQKCFPLLPEKITTDTATIYWYYAKALTITDNEQKKYSTIINYYHMAERFYNKNNSPFKLCKLLYDKTVFLSNYHKTSLATKSKKRGISLALKFYEEELLKKYTALDI